MTVACTFAAGLLALAQAASAHDNKVVVQQGEAAAAAISVVHNEGASGVDVHRGPAVLLPQAPLDSGARAYINGTRVRLDRLEPTGEWFLDRSGDRLVVVHCYAQQSVYVGGGKRIRCSSREF